MIGMSHNLFNFAAFRIFTNGADHSYHTASLAQRHLVGDDCMTFILQLFAYVFTGARPIPTGLPD